MATPNDHYDSSWKDAIEHYFPEFIAFSFPDAYAGIDWSKEYLFLDQVDYGYQNNLCFHVHISILLITFVSAWIRNKTSKHIDNSLYLRVFRMN